MKCKLRIFILFVIVSLVLANNAAAQARLVEKDASLILLSNQLIVDTESSLMWASHDNGQDITFEQAREYVSALRLADYTDWRLPTIQELETLLVKGSNNHTPPGPGCSGGYDIHRFFHLTCCCPWALNDNGTRPASFPFIPGMASGTMWHHKSGKSGNRVFPVRNLEAGWKVQH